jgi:hypothetical protein
VPEASASPTAAPPPARHEIRFRFDRAMIGAAHRPVFVARGLWFLAIVAGMVGVNWLLGGETPRLLLYTVAAVSLLVTGRLWQVWRQTVARSYDLWKKQAPDGEIVMRLDDEALQVCLGTGSMRYKWSDLLRLRRRPRVWCLEIVKHAHVLFPPSAASAEARDYVVERCRAVGVRV